MEVVKGPIRFTTRLDRATQHYANKQLAAWELARSQYLQEVARSQSIAALAPVLGRYLQAEFQSQAALALLNFEETGYACAADALDGLRERYSRMLVRGAFEPQPEATLAVNLVQGARRRAAIQFVADAARLLGEYRRVAGSGRRSAD